MAYNFNEIEQKWQKLWKENNTYRVVENDDKKKFYVLNMFPYPSGAGLHVGHPLADRYYHDRQSGREHGGPQPHGGEHSQEDIDRTGRYRYLLLQPHPGQ